MWGWIRDSKWNDTVISSKKRDSLEVRKPGQSKEIGQLNIMWYPRWAPGTGKDIR